MSSDLSLDSKTTRWGEAMIASAITQKPIDYIASSTLNELLDTLPTEHIDTDEVPKIGWTVIGIGSTYMESVSNPLTKKVSQTPTSYDHSNKHAVPFDILPYVMRKSGSDDLTNAERAKLGLMTVKEVDGVNYNCYFGRTLDSTNDKVTIDVVTTDDSGNVTGESSLEPSTEAIYPTADASYTGEVTSSNEYLRIRAPITQSLSASEVEEIINCAEILLGRSDITITEFGIVGGIEKQNTFIDGDTSISYTEIIGAQCAYFSELSFSTEARRDIGITIDFNIGQSMTVD